MELHGGQVFAESTGRGFGTTFVVNLSLVQNRRRDTVPAEHRKSALKKLQGIHALVVEDESDTRELIAETIERQGGRAQTADSYDAALAALERFTPDVLLIDIGMPEKDGYALMRAARSLPKLRHTPAIAVTAYARDTDRDAAIEAGFQAHVAKPFDPTALIEQIAELVNS